MLKVMVLDGECKEVVPFWVQDVAQFSEIELSHYQYKLRKYCAGDSLNSTELCTISPILALNNSNNNNFM